MRIATVTLLLLTGLGMSAAYAADSTTTSSPPSGTAEATVQTNAMEDPNRIVCKQYESTGSRLHGTRICHTVQEWEAIRHLSEMQVDKSSSSAAVAAIPPSSH